MNIQLNISIKTQQKLIRLINEQIAREEKSIKTWEDRMSFTDKEKAIELAQYIIDSHKEAIKELREELKSLTTPHKRKRFYEVHFTSKSWESSFICSWEGDLSKEELSNMVQEKTHEKPSLVIREIFQEEYDLLLKEEYRTLDNL